MTRTSRAAREPSGSAGERGGVTHWAGEPVQVWERKWGVPRVEAHERLGSTNDRLRELAREGARSFTVVLAEEQTAGRGRAGKSWHSPPGRGLWTSVLLPPERPGQLPLAPLLVGMAVCRAIKSLLSGVEPGVKWPNDVLVEGRKVCGVLCEGGGGGPTVAGIGINVLGGRAGLPPEIRARATTLAELDAGELRRSDVLALVIRHLREVVDPMPETLEGALGRELGQLDLLRGRLLRTEGGTRGHGDGIASDGALLVRTEDGSRLRIVAGSVTPEVSLAR